MFGSRFGWVIFLLFILNDEYSLGQVTYETGHLSSPRQGIASVVAEDLIYFAGGLEDGLQASKIVDIYNTTNGNWSTMTLPESRGYITTLSVDPNIYFIGGSDWRNIPYIYSTTLRDFIPLANTSAPTVRAPDQITMLNATLVVMDQFSINFWDTNMLEWSYSEELNRLMALYSSANIIVAEEVVILISPVQSTSAWVYDVRTKNTTEWKNLLDTSSSVLTRYEGSNGVVFLVFPDKCVLYNVAKNAWRTFTTSNIQLVSHYGDYSYVLGSTSFAESWNGSAPVTLNDTFTYAASFGPYIATFNLNLFRIYTPGLKYYSSIPYPTTSTTFTHGIAWGTEKFAFVDLAIVSVLKISILYYDSYGPFNPVPTNLLVGNDTLFIVPNNGLIVSIDANGNAQSYLPEFTPSYLVGNQFLSLQQSFTLQDINNPLNFSTNFDSSTLVSLNGNTLVAMSMQPTQLFYKAMDIYNYKTGTWTNGTLVPDQLFPTSNTTSPVPFTFMASSVIGDEIYVWHLDTVAVYNTTDQQWTTSNTSIQIHPVYGSGNIFTLEPLINNVTYIYTYPENYFYKFAPTDLTSWTPTSNVDQGTTQRYFAQRVVYNEKIYALGYNTNTSKYDLIYNYNTATNFWDLTILPNSLSYASMAIGGDTLIVFTTNSTLFYLPFSTGQWVTVDDFPYNFIPSTASVSNSKLVIGGGYDPDSASNTNLVLLFDISTFVAPPAAANQTTDQPSTSSTVIEGPIIAAIVVPIVAIVAAGVAVLIVLIRRRDKKGKNSVSMIGLEAKYGQWFIPFNNIQFGQQLGQGTNGQVFEGRWNNTQVALKVSMTQANISVISELSLMINMRPHPNIVQLLGFSVHPETDSIILVLEYCNERSLSTVLFDSQHEIEMTKKISWIKGIARGINHLHSNNVVHRDIAARNVLLHNNEVKVTDFGMSRLIDEQQQRGTTKSELGPIRWMAPEALKSKEYSVKSDVWSFGIIVYEILTQQEPHVKEDPITIGRLIRDEGKTPEIPPTCPPALATLMQHCWKMSPNERPSFDKLLQLLDGL